MLKALASAFGVLAAARVNGRALIRTALTASIVLSVPLLATQANAASFIIDAGRSGEVSIGIFSNFIPFQAQSLNGSAITFVANVHGLTKADPRFCSGLPPELTPRDCIEPIHEYSNGHIFTTSSTSTDFVFVNGNIPLGDAVFFGEIQFSSVTGPILITVNGTKLPEPASWAMMLAGFGAIGSAMRRRGRQTWSRA